MKNITKGLLSIFASVVIASSAFAGEVSVQGTAAMSYHISSSDSTTGANNDGKALGIANEVTFNASGEMDNGWTWKWQAELDSGAETTSGAGIDDSRLEVTTDYGTVAVYSSEGSLAKGKWAGLASAFGVPTDNGDTGGFVHGTNLSSFNSIQYHSPAGLLPLSTRVFAGRSIGDTSINSKNASGAAITQSITNAVSGTANAFVGDNHSQYAVTMVPMDGLNVKADYFDPGDIGSGVKQNPEAGNWGVSYAMGNVTVGYGRGYVATAIGGTVAASTFEDYENREYGIGFAVNDDLSVSYSIQKSDLSYTDTTADVELEVQSIQAAYTMGGMTVALSMDDFENESYTLNSDEKETFLTFTFAF